MKLAFLFLTQADHHQSELWQQFFESAGPNAYRIYAHPLFPDRMVHPLLKRHLIPQTNRSIVQATLLLLREAAQDPDNEFFVLLSESCVPLYSLSSLRAILLGQNQSWISHGLDGSAEATLRWNQQNGFVSRESFRKQHQWMLLQRELVELVLERDESSKFAQVRAADEHYFINLLAWLGVKLEDKVYNQTCTFVNWHDFEVHKSGNGSRFRPKTYRSLARSEVDHARGQGCLFFRKVSADCDCSVLKEPVPPPARTLQALMPTPALFGIPSPTPATLDPTTGLQPFTHSPQDGERLLGLYTQRRYDDLAAELLRIFDLLKDTFIRVSPETQGQLNEFVQTFLFLMTREDFALTRPDHVRAFIEKNALISNVVSLTAFKTTDAQLVLLQRQAITRFKRLAPAFQQNEAASVMLLCQKYTLGKLLALYSPRNATVIDSALFFDVDVELASWWLVNVVRSYHSVAATAAGHGFLKKHFATIDRRFQSLAELHTLGYVVSYIDSEGDRAVKQRLNTLLWAHIQRNFEKVRNRPNPRRIAVFSQRWFPGHSVYRNQLAFLKALHADYELVLFQLGEPGQPVDASLFQEVRPMRVGSEGWQSQLQDNDFQLAYFPDIGMDSETLFLSNMRVAPIQVTSYGHSVSTHGAGEVDYWIAGADVELHEAVEQNYSERVVLIPGLGIANVKPNYQPRRGGPRTDRLIVNCSWSPQKVIHPLVTMLEEIARRSPPNLLFRFFAGNCLMQSQSYLAFTNALKEMLGGERVEVMGQLSYRDYMTLLEEGSLGLDSYHYGGCNTIVDSLHLRKPIITYSGQKWYNRIGGALLKKVGLEEMVATSQPEYQEKAIRLINDAAWRSHLEARLAELDLDALLYDLPEEGKNFKHAIDYLITNHHQLKAEGGRAPIWVTAPGSLREELAVTPA